MSKLSLQEKRLQTLRRQLYSKPIVKENKIYETVKDSTPIIQISTQPLNIAEISYLRVDLLKVLILSTLAIGTQLLLYFASRNHLINLYIKF
ncbi:hypothetical protein HY025_03450 [Candidatus Daviesbacteria bacterium]|nr:hypothetical protein [Candidatus Daviesbacteria bacterium]